MKPLDVVFIKTICFMILLALCFQIGMQLNGVLNIARMTLELERIDTTLNKILEQEENCKIGHEL